MNDIFTVTEINNYIKMLMSSNSLLSGLSIRGEISNFKHHYSGHMYFTLKDHDSILKCVMFKSSAQSLRFAPENGMKVIASGYISVYERDGQYQLYISSMQPDGVGALHMAYEQLKEKLEKEGLFDLRLKKKIPLLPGKIGVVTSSTGAVIRDIINVAGRRNENMKILIYPVAVQGTQAAAQIAAAVRKLNELKLVDVIIVARGGGSLEELWAFNEEIVARSIFESKIPVISAVGHETDYTICDFVSDVRAPTPSAAAELAVPDREMLKYKLQNYNVRLKNALVKKLDAGRKELDKINSRPIFKHPLDNINQLRLKIDNLLRLLGKNSEIQLKAKKTQFSLLVGKLDALSPLKIFERGYCIARKPNGDVIRSIVQVADANDVEINVSDGQIYCQVVEVKANGKENR